MAMLRCPSCNTPMTAGEAAAGKCPMCTAEVAAPSAPERTLPTQAGPASRLDQAILIAVIGMLFFCLLPVGGIVYFSWPETPKKKEELAQENPPEKKEAKVEPKKKPSEPEKKPEDKKEPEKKDVSTPPEPKKTLDPPPEKKEEPKKIEVKEVAKKEEPKKVVEIAKKEEPKKIEPRRVAPEFPKRWTTLPYLIDDAIKLDGDLADWKDIAAVQLGAIERGKAVRKPVNVPATQKAYLAYCPKGLLIAVEVVDTSGELENQGKPAQGMWPFWDNDAVEIFVDTLNARPRVRGDASAHQFFAFPLGTPDDANIHGFESRILKNKAGRIDWTIAAVGKNSIHRAGKKTANGWTMEILITNPAFREGAIKPGAVFGFELQIDSGTNVFYQWANDNPLVQISTNPSVWGEILFAGTDAQVELLDLDKKPATKLPPGQSLLVRVRDADVNLDATKKERVTVTLLTRAGRRTLTLDETAPDSGVFEGLMPTRLTGGKADDAVLEIVPDETVTVDYMDQLRGDGSRNRSVRAAIRCR